MFNTNSRNLGAVNGAIEDPEGAMVDAESIGAVVEGGGFCSIESIVEMSLDTLFSSWLSCL